MWLLNKPQFNHTFLLSQIEFRCAKPAPEGYGSGPQSQTDAHHSSARFGLSTALKVSQFRTELLSVLLQGGPGIVVVLLFGDPACDINNEPVENP